MRRITRYRRDRLIRTKSRDLRNWKTRQPNPDFTRSPPFACKWLCVANLRPFSLRPNWIWGYADSGGFWPAISGMPVLPIEYLLAAPVEPDLSRPVLRHNSAS